MKSIAFFELHYMKLLVLLNFFLLALAFPYNRMKKEVQGCISFLNKPITLLCTSTFLVGTNQRGLEPS
jgi:hypothetical protein